MRVRVLVAGLSLPEVLMCRGTYPYKPRLPFTPGHECVGIVEDDEIKRSLAQAQPYQQWLDAGLVELHELPEREHVVFSRQSVLRRQQMFGYTHEELKVIIGPMAKAGLEPIGSMGTDTPIAVLSERPRLLFDYFQQLFAQVTNPPLDAIREEVEIGRAHV